MTLISSGTVDIDIDLFTNSNTILVQSKLFQSLAAVSIHFLGGGGGGGAKVRQIQKKIGALCAQSRNIKLCVMKIVYVFSGIFVLNLMVS